MSYIGVQLAKKHAFRDAAEIEDRAITIRPSSTAVFGMDSDDRYANFQQRRINPSYPFSITIAKNEALLNGFFTRLAATEFRMYWTLPNIHQAWGNNTLTYWESTTSAQHTITIPDGFYDLDGLMLVIEAEVQAQGFLPNFIAQAQEDGSTSYATGTPDTFYWVVPTSTTRTLYDMLNLITRFPPLVLAQTTARGGVANLKPTDYIDVISPQLTYNQDLKDGSTSPIVRDMLVRIYLDDDNRSPCRIITKTFDAVGNPTGSQVPQQNPSQSITGACPFMLYRQFPVPKQIQWNNTQPIGNLTFELYDDQGRSIQSLWNAILPADDPTRVGQFYANSFVWNMTLLITEN